MLTFDYYRNFADRVAGLKQQLMALLQELRGEGRRVAAYGASAKGSTLMNAFGIDGRLIEFVVDRSDLKQGRFIPGNHLPIFPRASCSNAGQTLFCCSPGISPPKFWPSRMNSAGTGAGSSFRFQR